MNTKQEPGVPKNQRKIRKKRKRRVNWLVPAILLAIILASSYLTATSYLKPYSAKSMVVEVEIPLGSSPSTIAELLAQKELIRHPKAFYYYTRLKGISQDLKAGTYFLDAAWTVEEIASALTKGGSVATVRFTIPEGLNLEQIAQRIEATGLVTAEEFLETAAHHRFDYDFLIDIPEGPKRLEGFLFPDTYEVRAGATSKDIIAMMLRRFEQIYNDEYRQRQQELGLSTLELVTMASIVEREAKLDEERKIIAGVFYNRLQQNWLLQSCATVQYLLDEPREVLLNKDLEIESPYNTYKYPGLPPGPIASPGKASLEAALYPADVDYLFFKVDPNGNGSHIFSRTLAEHNKAGK
ncbi:MAG: endolytic transglycosylase MltG [Clostridia bacterium]|nr:endolytic transglycosylase MltG [Clostridia bacterium]